MKIAYLFPIFLLPLISLIFFSYHNIENNSKIKIFYWDWAGNKTIDSKIKSIKEFCFKRKICVIEAKHIHIATFNKKNKFIYHVNKNFWEKIEEDSESIVLTVRLEKLPNVYDVGDVFNKYKNIAKKNNLLIDGIEIDFDSPSNKINSYINWLKKLSTLLENLKLEVTGLRSWVDDNEAETKKLLNAVNEINFQLYQYDKNILPTQNFINFVNNNLSANIAIYCNDYAFFERIIKYINKPKNLSVGFFINNNCPIEHSS